MGGHSCGSGCPTCLAASRRSKAPKKKVPRNSQCPCNSGKKYKTCCLKKDELAGKVSVKTAGRSKLNNAQRKKLMKAADDSVMMPPMLRVGPYGADGSAPKAKASASNVASASVPPPQVEILEDEEEKDESMSRETTSDVSEEDEFDEVAFTFDQPLESIAAFDLTPPKPVVRPRTRFSHQPVEEETLESSRKMFKGKRMGEENAEDWSLFQSKGDELMDKGLIQDALVFYSQALLSKPPDASDVAIGTLYLSRAKCYQKLGLASKSRFDCTKAAQFLRADNVKVTKEATNVSGEPKELSLVSVAKLQIRLQPLLANVVSLREWIGEDGAEGTFAKEFGPLVSLLENAELLALSGLANIQKQLIDSVLVEDDPAGRNEK